MLQKTILAVVYTLTAALLLSGLIATAEAKDAIVSAIRLQEAPRSTRFEVDLSKAVGFSVDVLSNPYRVIIDVAGVKFDLPPGVGRHGKGLITSFRYGLVEEGKSRIVLDTTGPVLIEKSSAVAGKGKNLAHISVTLAATSAEAFATTFAKDHADAAVTASIAPAVQDKKPESNLKIIVLDPGHGGIDPGAVSTAGTLEKTVVLNYGLALQNALQATGRYKVILTRSEDKFLPLEKRVAIARESKADLFIAIHADTVPGPQARGTTLYTVSDKASDAEAEELAAKENKADVIVGFDLGSESKDVANILINLAQRESRNRAVYFAKKAVVELKQVTAMTGKPIRSAAFVVLKAPDIPSLLIELGYLSTKEDEALLTSSTWHATMAEAMTRAIDGYFSPTRTVSQK